MAHVKVFEGRARIVSEVLTDENIMKASYLDPKALQLFDEKGNVTFRVGKSEEFSDVSNNGVIFNNGKAITNLYVNEEGKLLKEDEFVLQTILVKINIIEEQVEEVSNLVLPEIEVVE